jgi:hypothetical protein
MSRQQSDAPDKSEVPTHHAAGRSSKKKPWALWGRIVRDPPRWTFLRKGWGGWRRWGRYTTKEIAEKVAEDSARKHALEYEYRILLDSEGRPQ